MDVFRRGRNTEPLNSPLLYKIEGLDIAGVQEEEVACLSNAKVIIADYDLLQNDFAQLRDAVICTIYPDIGELNGEAKRTAIQEIIDRWLCHNAALISKRQLEQNEVNNDIEVNGRSTVAYRPPRYGRALVASVRKNHAALPAEEYARWGNEADGFLDLKGCGVGPFKTPRNLPHKTGLEYLGKAISAFAMEKMIQRIFAHTNVKFSTIPTYAILDAGFDYKQAIRGSVAAGIQVRRAHARPQRGSGLNLPELGSYEQKITIEIERLLRRYGITSSAPETTIEIDNTGNEVIIRRVGYPMPPSGDYPKHFCWTDKHRARLLQLSRAGRELISFEGMNIQMARLVDNDPSSIQLVDFTQYICRGSFEMPFYSRVRDQPMLWGAGFKPTDPDYVQPDPKLCLPVDSWNHLRRIGVFDMSCKLRSGLITRETIVQTLSELIQKSMERWY